MSNEFAERYKAILGRAEELGFCATSGAASDERAAFEAWFTGAYAQRRVYGADEEVAWIGFQARGQQQAAHREAWEAFLGRSAKPSGAGPQFAIVPRDARGQQQAGSDRLLKIIACAYQVAGAHDAPEHIKDVLADPEAATDEQVEAMLPYRVAEQQAGVPVEVIIRSNRVFIVKGVQSFMLAYEVGDDDQAVEAAELNWYADRLREVLSIITPCVKSEIPSAPREA